MDQQLLPVLTVHTATGESSSEKLLLIQPVLSSEGQQPPLPTPEHGPCHVPTLSLRMGFQTGFQHASHLVRHDDESFIHARGGTGLHFSHIPGLLATSCFDHLQGKCYSQ